MKPTVTTFALLLVVSLGCANSLQEGTLTSANSDVITREELMETGVGDLYQVVERLRPLCDDFRLARSTIFELLARVRQLDTVYKRSGAVHGCVLADGAEILRHVEDIGRHNAVDSISGLMWMQSQQGSDKIFYTTGRLNSEMVIKGPRWAFRC